MIGVMLNSQPYYYHRNLQGDVIAIYDANGEKQVDDPVFNNCAHYVQEILEAGTAENPNVECFLEFSNVIVPKDLYGLLSACNN